MIQRTIFKTLQDHFFDRKAIVVIGPRQTGKTTLLRQLASTYGEYLYLDGDDASMRQTLTDPSYERLNQLIGDHRIVFVDEAQRIGNAGITLKMMIDRFPGRTLQCENGRLNEIRQAQPNITFNI